MEKITIVGCGAYGLALATVLHSKNQVTVYTKFEEEKEEVLKTHQRSQILPGILLPDFKVTCRKEDIEESDILILAVPFSYLEETFVSLASYLSKDTLVVVASKGMDEKTGKTAYELLSSLTSLPILVLSGPSFAIDLALLEPAVLTIGAVEQAQFDRLKACFTNSVFLEYTPDILGVSYCGAFKNVFAILYGYLEGKNISTTTKSAILYRSLLELNHLLKQCGCMENSILTASGIADFYMTCESKKSRNHTFGVLLATKSREEIENYLKETTVEGVTTLKACLTLIQKKNITSPIFELLQGLVQGKMVTAQEILEALSR